MVYLNKWTTTIPGEDQKIQYIQGVTVMYASSTFA